MLRIKNTLGLDIGGTSIKAGFLPGPRERCLHFKQYDTPKKSGELLALLMNTIIDYCSRYRVEAIGVGCPGPLDIKKGVVIKTPNLPWKNLPLQKILRQATRLPVTLDNDASAFTLAEAVWGAGKKYQNVVGLTLGTGVGGGFVINKKIYHGRSNAAELGYTLMGPKGPRGPFGERGAAQEYVRGAKTNWRAVGSALGYAIASITHIVDPDIVIIGGRAAKAWPKFINPLKISLRQNCVFPNIPPIKRSRLGDQAGIIGAALLTIQSSS